MTLRLLLHVFLFCCLVCWLTLVSGCSTTPVQIPPGLRAKPTTCLLAVPDSLPYLTAEYKQLGDDRLQLSIEFYKNFLTMTGPQRDAAVDRILAIDSRMTQLVVENHTAAGMRYQTAVAELLDCQGWVRDQP